MLSQGIDTTWQNSAILTIHQEKTPLSVCKGINTTKAFEVE